MRRNVDIWRDIDKISILLFLFMVIMGWFNIYAAVYNEEHKEILDLSQRYGKQFIWILATFVLAVFVVIVDSRFYLFFAYFIYAGLMLLLLAVLVFGKEINGARSWFEFGGVSLQPSEFAKFGTALALAGYLTNRRQELTKLKVILPAVGIIMFPALLIALQPDMGSSIIFFAFFLVLFREGMSPYIFISGLLMLILFFLTLLIDNLYLQAGLVVIGILLSWFTIRNMKVWLTGLGILIVIGSLLYVLDHFVFRSMGKEFILLAAVIVSGIAFAYYIYVKKAIAFLVVFLFLLGSLLFVNLVDFAFNNVLKPHQRERVEIMLGLIGSSR